jgi:hypothetical protein
MGLVHPHHHQHPAEAAWPGHLEQGEVGERADAHDGRALLDAVVEQVERGTGRCA